MWSSCPAVGQKDVKLIWSLFLCWLAMLPIQGSSPMFNLFFPSACRCEARGKFLTEMNKLRMQKWPSRMQRVRKGPGLCCVIIQVSMWANFCTALNSPARNHKTTKFGSCKPRSALSKLVALYVASKIYKNSMRLLTYRLKRRGSICHLHFYILYRCTYRHRCIHAHPHAYAHIHVHVYIYKGKL